MRKYKFWIIVAIILMIINVITSFVWNDQFTNIFTTISGWVSGIATIVLGLIALHQNKAHKIENDKNLKKEYDLSVF